MFLLHLYFDILYKEMSLIYSNFDVALMHIFLCFNLVTELLFKIDLGLTLYVTTTQTHDAVLF